MSLEEYSKATAQWLGKELQAVGMDRKMHYAMRFVSLVCQIDLSQVPADCVQAISMMQDNVANGDGEFFEYIAKIIRGNSQRLWLVDKHCPVPEGTPRYTESELMALAKQDGIQIHRVSLYRLMKDLGYTFRNSKKPKSKRPTKG